ncbi:hypothetical protein LCGC14_2482310 [marine sediment metagenome]|uniref:Uncharacterized protein n=1 Tax=marine sediment metagenome TaxID=412755 RepID=A0A0F9B824_9ZZZZ
MTLEQELERVIRGYCDVSSHSPGTIPRCQCNEMARDLAERIERLYTATLGVAGDEVVEMIHQGRNATMDGRAEHIAEAARSAFIGGA